MSRVATLLIIFFTLAASIADAQDSTSVVDTPVSLPERFLIINSFDAQSMEGRKKKKELFAELADSLQQILYRKLEPRYKDRITIIPGVFHVEQNNTSSWSALMDSNQASSAIIIRHLDAYFEKTDVEVTGEKNNKTRTVSYDICSKVSYALYESDTLSRDTRIDLCLPYTQRNSMSGLLTFGPDIVGKRKDAFKIIEQNADKLFLSPELPLFPRRRTGPDRLRPADTALKYTISFADLAQLSYDGSKLKNYINQPFSESGDVAYYSETEKSNFWRTVKPSIDTYMAFATEYGAKSPAFLADAYTLVLKTKGYLIGSTRKVRNAILNSGDSTTLRLYNNWLNLKITLSTYYSSTLEDLKDDHVDLADVERQVNDIEKELARRSEPFSLAYSSSNISLDDVKAALKEGEAAVEIVRIYHYYGEQKGIPEYIALVVKKDEAFPELVKLGIGDSLERSDLGYYKKCILTKTPDARSYDRYWKPLESALGKSKIIYLSQDGVYNSINLNTLQRPDSRFLLDDYQIELVSNTRELAGILAAPIPMSREELDAILIGSPVYGNDILIPPLPGSKEEIKKIDTLLLKGHLKTEVLLDQLASEKNLKQAHQPFILHIATHGFFNENVDLSKSMNNGWPAK